MSSSRNGKYQTGREVFEKYIPNYTPPRPHIPRSPFDVLRKDPAKELVDELLKEFAQHLSGINKQRASPS